MKRVVLVMLLLVSLIVSGCGEPSVTGVYISSGESPIILVIYQNGTCLARPAGTDYDTIGRWEVVDFGGVDMLVAQVTLTHWALPGGYRDYEFRFRIEDDKLISVGGDNEILVKQEGAL